MITDRQLLKELGAVALAFYGRFAAIKDIQRQALRPILAGQNVLVTSPTASGKTEAVFAPLVARLNDYRRQSSNRIIFLVVAPTRSLVNDLYKRLASPLEQLNWTCGRQTADRADKHWQPHVLITTPESFDSMLVRGGTREKGILTDHLLAKVGAVFLDEAHLFFDSPRGEQLLWLLARLRRLRRYACQQGWTSSPDIQLCAASATLAQPEKIAHLFLGPAATIVHVPGVREFALLHPMATEPWLHLAPHHTVAAVLPYIVRLAPDVALSRVSDFIWQAMTYEGENVCRKVLVFVPTRALCDQLAAFLRHDLGRRRALFISGHHGSLEKTARELAETEFARQRDAILVATTTLEVGIDIGDVDLVVLFGAPPDTSNFLQRVGRAGRRAAWTQVMALARDELEARAFASIIQGASRGDLEEGTVSPRWSVFVQQTASSIVQTGGQGRRRPDLLQLAKEVWPEQAEAAAPRILEHLLTEGILTERHGRFFLGERLSELQERGGGTLHHNFATESKGLPVINAGTGEVLAWVASPPTESGPVALAGRHWHCTVVSDEIILSPTTPKQAATACRYASRGAPCRRASAAHVQRGLGLAPHETIVISGEESVIWWHFGGFAYEQLLLAAFHSLRAWKHAPGLAVLGNPDLQGLYRLARQPLQLRELVASLAAHLAPSFSPGKYHDYLPDDVQQAVTAELFDLPTFCQWLQSLKLIHPPPSDPLYKVLHETSR